MGAVAQGLLVAVLGAAFAAVLGWLTGSPDTTYATDAAWLPLLDALIAELTTGNITPREDADRLLADAEAAYRAAGGT
jgi:hypothetical protein